MMADSNIDYSIYQDIDVGAQRCDPSIDSSNTSVLPLPYQKSKLIYSNEQKMILETEFNKNRYLTRLNCFKLSQKLKISEKRVKIWFQNNRAKEKKIKKNKSSKPMKTAGDLDCALSIYSDDVQLSEHQQQEELVNQSNVQETIAHQLQENQHQWQNQQLQWQGQHQWQYGNEQQNQQWQDQHQWQDQYSYQEQYQQQNPHQHQYNNEQQLQQCQLWYNETANQYQQDPNEQQQHQHQYQYNNNNGSAVESSQGLEYY